MHKNPKIMSLADAAAKVKSVQATGKKVGFTNGCFDLLHLGHLASIQQAKSLCDFLVVAVNTDVSVRKLKGPTRPVHDETTRTEILAALACVDLVVLFGDNGSDTTAISVVDALRPNIMGKEGYTIDRWPEAQFAQKYGCEIVTLNRIDGYSTTHLVTRIKSGES